MVRSMLRVMVRVEMDRDGHSLAAGVGAHEVVLYCGCVAAATIATARELGAPAVLAVEH